MLPPTSHGEVEGEPAGWSPPGTGRVIILNGAPRSGKSTIVRAIQRLGRTTGHTWLNLGVDTSMAETPRDLLPGIGLRPGGEQPDLEPAIVEMFVALYESIATHARSGQDVVVDVGHHDAYSRPLHVLPMVARLLLETPTVVVGVRCPLDVIMRRRDVDASVGIYATSGPHGEVPDAVVRWQHHVHEPGIYDLDVDTSVMSADHCAAVVLGRFDSDEPLTAIRRLAALTIAEE